MRRFLIALLVPALVCGMALSLHAEEAPAEEATPTLDTDEVAVEALKAFKTEYKAKGLKGDDKIAARVYAIKNLAVTQHPKVAKQLAKLARLAGDGNKDVRTAAVQYLGMQKALAGFAGGEVVKAIQKNDDDHVIVISGLQSLQDLQYQAAPDLLRALMKHKEYSVQKAAMFAIAELGDMRLAQEVFKLLAEIKKLNGESWDGVNVTYDTGTAGTHDQEMAEKIGKAEMAKNKRKGRRGARSQRDMGPVVEEVLKRLTGEEFEKQTDAEAWFTKHADAIKQACDRLDAIGESQVKEAKDTR